MKHKLTRETHNNMNSTVPTVPTTELRENSQPPKAELTLDFIAGLITGNGSFLWIIQNTTQEIPVFQLKMPIEDLYILEAIKAKLNLKEKIHSYSHQDRHYAILLIRKRSTIENKLIPALEERLWGTKKQHFDAWKKKLFENKFKYIYKQHI